MEIFAVKWNVVSEISKVLLNDIFAVDDILTKITAESAKKLYQWGDSQALSRCFSVFSVRIWGGGYQLFFDCRSCMYHQQLLGLMSFTLNLKNKIAKFP